MNKERLLKLANHLLHGKLGHEVFDFNVFHKSSTYGCGTRGCALGECPTCFPEDWEFGGTATPVLIGTSLINSMATRQSAKTYFELNNDEYKMLFMPSYLPDTATKEQVANNIIEFCKQ